MIHPTNFAVLAGLAAQATAATIPVSVGKTGLTFEPSIIKANQGDVIEFRFWPRNHSVVAGEFTSACKPANHGGFFSGFFPTQPGTVNTKIFRVTVTHTNPIPIYCSQNTGQHCKNGMVAVINPAGSGHLTFDAYAELARNAGNATSPSGGPFGGVVALNGGATTTSASASSTSTASDSVTVTTTVTDTKTDTKTKTHTGTESGSATETGTQTKTETETSTETSTETETTVTETGATATGGGDGIPTDAATTGGPIQTGNAAGGVAVPLAGLVAVAVAAFFV